MTAITKISFKNYKGFESGFLEFKSLNILVGANSAGKSSLLNLVLLLAQSISNRRAPLFLYKGPLVDIGEKKNLYKNYDSNNEMEFTFEFRELISLKPALLGCLDNFSRQIRGAIRDLNYRSGEGERARLYLRELMKSAASYREKIDLLTETAQFLKKIFDKDSVSEDSESLEHEPEIRVNYQDVLDALLICDALEESQINRITYTVRHNPKIDAAEIVMVKILHDDFVVIQLKLKANKRAGKNVLIQTISQARLRRHYATIIEEVRSRSFGLNRSSSGSSMTSVALRRNPIGTLFGIILSKVTAPIISQFTVKKIHHISPLRAYPRRFYFVDGDELDDTEMGTNESERIIKLLRQNVGLADSVNVWLNKLGISISLDKVHDSIYKILVSNSNLKTDPTNVGFGLSQILPVIVEPLIASEGDIVIIQQPEIHLHPKAQSILGDFFIWVAKERKISVFIETHSEYLLRRIRRRTSEGVRFLTSEFNFIPSQLSILSIEKSDTTCQVKEIQVNENGTFQWPEDFLENEVEDLIAYMNATAENTPPIQESRGA